MKELPFDPYDFFGYIASGILVVFGLEMTFGIPHVIGQELKVFDLLALSIGVYVAGHLMATPSKWLLEDVVVRKILKTPAVNLMGDPSNRPILSFIFPGYYRPLPQSIQLKILEIARKEGVDNPSGESLFLHIRYREYVLNNPNLKARLQSFLNKYGFSRNLCFTSFVFGLSIIIVRGFDISTGQTKYAIFALVSGILLFLRYIKFFYWYSFELFNVYAGSK